MVLLAVLAAVGAVGAVGAGLAHATAPASTAASTTGAARAVPVRDLSREQATQLVQQRYGARVVRTEVVEQSGREIFVFRLLSSGGKVWTVRIDAQSGAEVP